MIHEVMDGGSLPAGQNRLRMKDGGFDIGKMNSEYFCYRMNRETT